MFLFLLQYEDTTNGVEYDSSSRKVIISTPSNLQHFVVPSSVEIILGGDSSSKSSFDKCRSSIISITFEDNSKVFEIDEWVFSYSSLETIDMHTCDRLPYLNNSLFSNSRKLNNINFPQKIKELRYGCFYNCESLKSVTLPDSLETIYDWSSTHGRVFNDYLESVTITSQSNLTTILSDAFYQTKLKYFYIPPKLKTIISSAFTGVPIERFDVDQNNPYFKSEGNILYSGANNNTLHFVPSSTSGTYIIPSFVININDNCFRSTKVTQVIIHENVESIGTQCFTESTITSFTYNSKITRINDTTFVNCHSLDSIAVNDVITEIGQYAFSGCNNLKNIRLPANLVSIGYLHSMVVKNLMT